MASKVYVDVVARFYADGRIRPEKLYWEDGRAFEIQKVFDVRPAASLKAGGAGIRYDCLIEGRRKFLFLEESRWFVEGL